jgi:hypothetical protein
VAYVGHPSYSGCRGQEDHSSNIAHKKYLCETLSEKHFTKIGLVKWLKVKVLSLSTSTKKKKKSYRGEPGNGSLCL